MPYNVILDTEGIVRYTDSGFSEAQLHNIIENYMSIDHPELMLDVVSISGDANADGRPDPGESVDLALSLRNSPIAVDATDISVTLQSSSDQITITNATVGFPNAAAGDYITSDGNFSFTVNEGIEPGWAMLQFNWSCSYAEGNQSGTIEYNQRLGRPDLLIVDSDGAMDDNEHFVTDVFDAESRGYDLWSGGDLPASEIMNYSEIFWVGGTNTSDLNVEQANCLVDFMAQGGLLVLSSQYASDNEDLATFFSTAFGVGIADADGGSIFLAESPAGESYFNDISVVATGSSGANNNEDPDVLEVTGSTNVMFNWTQGDEGVAAVYRHIYNHGLFIFAGFPLESMRVYSSLPNSIDYAAFVDRVYQAYELVTSIDDPTGTQPMGFNISQVYPNPFNPNTSVSLQMAVAAEVELGVYDLLGRQVATLAQGELAAGEHQFTFNAGDLGSGLYFVQLSVDGVQRDTAAITLVK